MPQHWEAQRAHLRRDQCPLQALYLVLRVFDCLSGLFGQRELDGRFVFQSDDAVVSVAS